MFQGSLQKQGNNFTNGIVPQLNCIEEPVSTHLEICIEWESEFFTFF